MNTSKYISHEKLEFDGLQNINRNILDFTIVPVTYLEAQEQILICLIFVTHCLTVPCILWLLPEGLVDAQEFRNPVY